MPSLSAGVSLVMNDSYNEIKIFTTSKLGCNTKRIAEIVRNMNDNFASTFVEVILHKYTNLLD